MPLFKRGQYWYIRIQYQGHIYKFSSECKVKADAIKIENEFRRRLILGDDLIGLKKINLVKLSELFLQYQKREFSESHYQSLDGRFRKWILSYFGNIPSTKLSTNKIKEFLA